MTANRCDDGQRMIEQRLECPGAGPEMEADGSNYSLRFYARLTAIASLDEISEADGARTRNLWIDSPVL